FNDARETMHDAEGFVSATWSRSMAAGGQASAALGYHTSAYQGAFPQSDGLYGDESHGRWLSADASWLRPVGRHHKLIGGAEYRESLAQQKTSWKVGDPPSSQGNDTRTDLCAVFLQDEMRIGSFILNGGA